MTHRIKKCKIIINNPGYWLFTCNKSKEIKKKVKKKEKNRLLFIQMDVKYIYLFLTCIYIIEVSKNLYLVDVGIYKNVFNLENFYVPSLQYVRA